MHDWLLLIYSLPSQPSRRRAYVWRELKKLGALYLRDGVALLPRRPDLLAHLDALTERIDREEGNSYLVVDPPFAGSHGDDFVKRFNDERAAEYGEIYHSGVRFLRDVLEDVDRDDFGFPDVDNLESELGRLVRWLDQVKGRDYFSSPMAQKAEEILAKCETAFERFVSEASEREEGPAAREDVFDRLAGSAGSPPDDYPL
ncbi:MAG TPA: Chromate resistance protein ChrB [Chloroflexota bacterium]|nr:Chromate resistance protein ChrB [Chloroflexota bacterium]